MYMPDGSNGQVSTLLSTASEEAQLDRIQTPKETHIVTQVEPSFFDELAKETPLWLSNPWEHPKVKKMSLSKTILCEGFLNKKSRDEHHQFKSRYFVLYQDRLEVFRDQKEAVSQKAQNIMLLASVRLDLRPVCDEDLKQLNEQERYFLMFLSCKMRFFLFAQDQETQTKWIKYLKQACILTNYSQTYENIKVLGRGTFAKVFLAKQGRGEFAVKTFDKRALLESKSSEKTRSGLLNEIQILRKCDHQSIIKLYEVYESDNYIYLVQNVLRGGELFDTIISKGNFSEKTAASIIQQLLSALNYIHSKNIMHRDIKPENLILVDKTDDFQIKLADFGLAAFTGENLLFKRCGTPGYVAPEILDDKKYNEKVDIFSSGVILYILLTGCSPFYGKDYNEIINKNRECKISFKFNDLGVKVSNEATDLLKKMLEVDPIKRISAAQALNHPFFKKTCKQNHELNTSIDQLDTGFEDSSAFDNMLNFQSKFNVQNIKPLDVKLSDTEKQLYTMTPMLGGRNLINSQGDDILNFKEKWMSPQKQVKPGDYKQVESSTNQNGYMNKLMGTKPDNINNTIAEETTSIPETPMAPQDQQRKLTQVRNLEILCNLETVSVSANPNNNNSSSVKDKLKTLL